MERLNKHATTGRASGQPLLIPNRFWLRRPSITHDELNVSGCQAGVFDFGDISIDPPKVEEHYKSIYRYFLAFKLTAASQRAFCGWL
jgi:hypothetical protein